MYVPLLMALYNAMRRLASSLATETTLSSRNGVISSELFPNSILGRPQAILDWFSHTVKLNAPSPAADPNNADHLYGVVFKGGLKSDTVVNKAMHCVPCFWNRQRAMISIQY